MEIFTPTFILRLTLVTLFYSGVLITVIWYNRSDGKGAKAFYLIDLLMENGKASKWSVIIMITFGLSCVIMTGWFLAQTLVWNDFLTFCGVWIVPLLAKMFAPNGGAGTGPPTMASKEEKYHG